LKEEPVHDLNESQSRLLDALRRTGETTGRQLAETTGLAYSTVTRMLRELADLGLAAKHDTPAAGPAEPGRPRAGKSPTLWRPAGAPPAGQAQRDPAPAEAADGAGPEPAAAQATATGGNGASAAGAARLGKGELRGQVLAVLRDHAGAELGPTQIAKHLAGRSQGAIANACDRLVKDGLAQLASDKPRRYAVTAAATAAAASGG
jgi:DNA-binding MarR family transcriptional regulator